MPIVRNCLAACAVLVCFTAQAQVLRCTDARTGQVTYTDVWLWHKSGKFQLDTLTEGQM